MASAAWQCVAACDALAREQCRIATVSLAGVSYLALPWVAWPGARTLLALVIAESRYIAEDACEDIVVDLEPLPVVTDLEKAIEKAGATLITEHAIASSRIDELEAKSIRLPELKNELQRMQIQWQQLVEPEESLSRKRGNTQELNTQIRYLESSSTQLEQEVREIEEKKLTLCGKTNVSPTEYKKLTRIAGINSRICPVNINQYQIWKKNGLGNIELERLNPLTIRVTNCFECSDLPISGRPLCAFESGVFTSLFSTFYELQKKTIETHCYAMGSNLCRFEVESLSLKILSLSTDRVAESEN
jgi:hypothetical protein